jgi:hypothetical protein
MRQDCDMPDNRDEYEPIIATRPRREPLREDTQPLWRLVLVLSAGLAAAVLLVWWLMGRSSGDGASKTGQTEEPFPAVSEEVAPEVLPEVRLDREPPPPAKEPEDNADIAQAPAPPPASAESAVGTEPAPTPESTPAVVPNDANPPPAQPAPASLRLMSPDSQVRFELRGPLDSSPPLAGKAGDVLPITAGTYRVVSSGAQLETLEQEITLNGEGPAEYTVELCAQPKQELETLARRIVEERPCASTVQCESMFAVLSEHAEQLVKDPAFRRQQCAKWRTEAEPEGRWTLDTKCDGATLATTCRIEISQGVCSVTEPKRSVRGGECPRAELK